MLERIITLAIGQKKTNDLKPTTLQTLTPYVVTDEDVIVWIKRNPSNPPIHYKTGFKDTLWITPKRYQELKDKQEKDKDGNLEELSTSHKLYYDAFDFGTNVVAAINRDFNLAGRSAVRPTGTGISAILRKRTQFYIMKIDGEAEMILMEYADRNAKNKEINDFLDSYYKPHASEIDDWWKNSRKSVEPAAEKSVDAEESDETEEWVKTRQTDSPE